MLTQPYISQEKTQVSIYPSRASHPRVLKLQIVFVPIFQLAMSFLFWTPPPTPPRASSAFLCSSLSPGFLTDTVGLVGASFPAPTPTSLLAHPLPRYPAVGSGWVGSVQRAGLLTRPGHQPCPAHCCAWVLYPARQIKNCYMMPVRNMWEEVRSRGVIGRQDEGLIVDGVPIFHKIGNTW